MILSCLIIKNGQATQQIIPIIVMVTCWGIFRGAENLKSLNVIAWNLLVFHQNRHFCLLFKTIRNKILNFLLVIDVVIAKVGDSLETLIRLWSLVLIECVLHTHIKLKCLQKQKIIFWHWYNTHRWRKALQWLWTMDAKKIKSSGLMSFWNAP